MNKEVFNSKLSEIINGSFIFLKDWGRWERKSGNRVESIDISYNDYSTSFIVKGISVSVYFSEVERIFRPIYEQSKVMGLYNHATVHQSLINVKGVDYKLLETEIINDDTFNEVASEIKKLIQAGALPFFERYQTLLAVFENAERMPIEQMSNFIGQPLPFRRMIIKKLCNDVGYDEYYKLIVDFYRTEGGKEEVKLAEQLHRTLGQLFNAPN